MRRWQEPFLGRRELPEDINDFEIAHFFSFEEDELRAIRSRRKDHHRLAAALHIGFIKTTGTPLDAFESLPPRLLKHLGQQLQINVPDLASLRTLYRRRQTLFDHQNWAANIVGFSKFTGGRRSALRQAVKKETQNTTVVDLLITFCKRWLYEHKILIPSQRAISDISRVAHSAAEQEMFDVINETVPRRVLHRWHRALFKEHPPFPTMLAWLQAQPKARSTATVGSQTDRIQALSNLNVDKYDLKSISLARQRHYAWSARRRKPSRMRILAEPRRTLEIVCLLRVGLLELTDLAISISDMRGRDVVRQASKVVSKKERVLLGELETMTVEIEQMARDSSLSDLEARRKILDRIVQDVHPRSTAARIRYTLSDNAKKTRPLVKRLLNLKLREEGKQPTIKALALLRKVYEKRVTRLPKGTNHSFGPRWDSIIEHKDRARALRGFEAATLEALRDGLRSGSIWAPDSIEHQNKDKLFIPQAEWKKKRRYYFRRLGLPRDPEKHLKPLEAGIKAGLEALEEAVKKEEVQLSKRGVHIKALEKEDTPTNLAQTRKELFNEIGPIQLPKLLVEMDSLLCFSHILLGRAPRSEIELLTTYGGLLAHGTAFSPAEVALMIPEVTSESIASAMLHLEDETTLRKANDVTVDFLCSHEIAEVWGDGTIASADGMSLEASRLLWSARVDPRRRKYAIATYTHLLNQWGIIYDQPVVLGRRQAGAAIEGALRQNVSKTLTAVAVDSHGHTNFGTAVGKLVQRDLCPRLSHLKNRRLHVPIGFDVPENLESVVDRDISRSEIFSGYDGLVRVAASIKFAGTSANVALDRYSSAARGDRVYQAGTALGKLHLTLFLCDYYTNPDFRRELSRLLDYGETVHTLQRALYRGGIAASRGRRKDELIAISNSLTLLTNLTMAWWTHKLQGVLDRRKQAGLKEVDEEILRHISPVHFEAMNLRGELVFPVSAYAHRIFPTSIIPVVRQG